MSRARRRVLFVAEAVTLAHVARPHVLANALPADCFDVLFACDPRYERLFGDASYRRRSIHSIPSKQFMAALAKGSPVYDAETLQGYVREDLAVIDEFQPDVIVGDFRLSLSISARLRGIAYIGITNAYWSPNAAVRFVAPDLPLTRFLGKRVADAVFRTVRPLAFAIHARPMNQVRRSWGLKPLGNDVRRAYTDADVVLFADVPELVSMRRSPPHEHFVGPINWSPAVGRPAWWDELDRSLPTAYVTLGSSGDSRRLPELVSALSERPINVAVSTAGASVSLPTGGNIFVADYLPGDAISELASIVICNGGSPTSHQGLLGGCPIIGIPRNLDQTLNMAGIKSAGVGTMVRPRKQLGRSVCRAVDGLLADPEVALRVASVQHAMKRSAKQFNLCDIIDAVAPCSNRRARGEAT